jgi:ketosteroid isomerase-like protein
MSSLPSTPQSTIHKTTLSILAGYQHQSLEEIMAFFTPDCIHVFSPSSLSISGTPMSNTAYSTFYASVIPKIWNFKLTISEIIESPQSNKVVVFGSSTADSKAGVGTYGQEYILVFEFDETGEKIKKTVEWADSARAKAQAGILFG